MSGFDSLTWAFEGWFDRPLRDLPEELRKRVEREFSPMPWDSLSANQRRSVALQFDYQHDPATEQDQKFWWDFFLRQGGLKDQIAEWGAVATPTAGELALKESRLKELRQELARMEQQQRQARGDYYPQRPRADGDSVDAPGQYVAYPKAMKSLATRLNATPEEVAAWVWMSAKDGGLTAYLNANELDPPPQFYYTLGNADDFDYLSPLMACWFKEDDIAYFEPADRFITGKALIERWSGLPGIQPEAFIRAKIAESRLRDGHPRYGCTRGTCPEKAGFPPLATGLFALSEVKEIEAEDFGIEQTDCTPDNDACPEVGSPEWRRQNAIAAANAKHDQPGGSREKQRKICAIWATGKYSSRDLCAEQECATLDMSFAAARRALTNTPDPESPAP